MDSDSDAIDYNADDQERRPWSRSSSHTMMKIRWWENSDLRCEINRSDNLGRNVDQQERRVSDDDTEISR